MHLAVSEAAGDGAPPGTYHIDHVCLADAELVGRPRAPLELGNGRDVAVVDRALAHAAPRRDVLREGVPAGSERTLYLSLADSARRFLLWFTIRNLGGASG